jgi:hypothetical protein
MNKRIEYKKIFYEGALKIPVLERYHLSGEFRPNGIRLEGGRYVRDVAFELLSTEFSLFEEAVDYWNNHNIEWASLISTGHSWCGMTGYIYQFPNSDKEEKKETDFKINRSSVPVSENYKSLEIISLDYINEEQTGISFKIFDYFIIKLERYFMELDKGILIQDGRELKHSICLSRVDLNTLEQFIKLYPLIKKEYFTALK